MKKACSKCGKESKLLGKPFIELLGKDFCQECAEKVINEVTSGITVTTTNNIDGYVVSQYIDIESVEIVIGTGFWSEFTGEVADLFGERSTPFEKKLQKAKSVAFRRLKFLAFEKGGNAVIGVDIDYTEFSGNRIGVVANGTLVKVEAQKP